MAAGPPLRVLELYAGIGGFAAALGTLAPERAEVVAAVDIHRGALAVYAENFPHPVVPLTLESLSRERLRAWDADFWWLSPPCQPFTRRGLRRDLDDPRCRSLLALLDLMVQAPPRYLALENVPGFAGSRMHELLRRTLERAGFADVVEHVLCPTELGVPNRRRRFYLLASRQPLGGAPARERVGRPLQGYLDPDGDWPQLRLDPRLVASYDGALHVVERDDPQAVTTCFTSAYGRSPVRSGSYLRTADGPRRFAPREILRLLGFPAGFRLPPDLGLERAWRLVGNSLSIVAIRWLLAPVFEAGSETCDRPR